MIIERWTFTTKPGGKYDLVSGEKAWLEWAGSQARVCTYAFGPHFDVIVDFEFESDEDRQKFWAGVDRSHSTHVEWLKRMRELVANGRKELLYVQ